MFKFLKNIFREKDENLTYKDQNLYIDISYCMPKNKNPVMAVIETEEPRYGRLNRKVNYFVMASFDHQIGWTIIPYFTAGCKVLAWRYMNKQERELINLSKD